MRKRNWSAHEKGRKNQALSRRAEKAMVKEQTSGRFLRWAIGLPGLQQRVDQHEQLPENGNDGFLLAEHVSRTRGRSFCLNCSQRN